MSESKYKDHGDVIVDFNEFNNRLKKFNMHIVAWGRLAIANDDDPYGHKGYVLNNVTDIGVIGGFVAGLEYSEANK